MDDNRMNIKNNEVMLTEINREVERYVWREDIFDGQSEQKWWNDQDISYSEWVTSWEKSLNITKKD